ncbi:MAG: shikimate dehydrogenase [Verrucomicrobiota bacterium]
MLMEDRVLNLESIGELAPSPALYGVLGHPVAHSLSPGFQTAGFAALDRDAQYVKIDAAPENLPAVVAKMKELGFAGWNVTVPLKNHMHALCDELDEQATLFGAVNTVLHSDGQLLGFNTDGIGWDEAIREDFHVDVGDLRILILGAGGGAGRALSKYAALQHCERLVLVNRTPGKAEELAAELRPVFASDKLEGPHDRCTARPLEPEIIEEELATCDLLVNATSVGLKPTDPPLLPSGVLAPHLLVYDTIYRPARTRLLRDAEARGARVANGLSMLLHQGAAAFSIWTGQEAPLAAMRERLMADARAA